MDRDKNMNDWKEETCEFCIFRVGEMCRQNPYCVNVVMMWKPSFAPACSKLQYPTTSNAEEGNFCQCPPEITKGVGAFPGQVGILPYMKDHKMYIDTIVCWKCLLPRK